MFSDVFEETDIQHQIDLLDVCTYDLTALIECLTEEYIGFLVHIMLGLQLSALC